MEDQGDPDRLERAAGERPFLYLLMNAQGERISGSLEESPVGDHEANNVWESFQVTETDPDGAPVKRPARGFRKRHPVGF